MKKGPSERESIVFVVDDDAPVREALQRLFRSAGLQAQTFGTTTEFLNAKLPDVASCLVLDVRLPGTSGLDFQSELAKAKIQRSDHFHHRPRRHSDVCQSHEGWSCRIPDQTISRPGAAGRYRDRAQPRSYQARK